MASRVGLSMRTIEETRYPESRDALAHDWYAFLELALPGVAWMPLPNLGAAVTGHLDRWRIDALVLTGGNDLGESSVRDVSERAALGWAIERRIPVLGICRGLQLVHSWFGGRVEACSRERHVATDHRIRWLRRPRRLPSSVELPERVNSYHGQGVGSSDLAAPLRALAVADDGVVESLEHPDHRILAIQWHPERQVPPREPDRALFRAALGGGE